MKSRKRKERNYGVLHYETAALVAATPEQQRQALRSATPEQLLKLDSDFEMWAHANQLPPNGEGWRVWLMMAGRGFGKTRAGAEWIYRLADGKAGSRIALAGATIGDARTIMVEGVSGLLSIARRNRRRLRWEPSLSRLSWPNGSVAQLFSGDHADGLRGPEHDFAWADELAKWRQADETWMNLRMGLRRGPRPRVLVTTITTGGRTQDNINLDEKVIDMLTATYGGTRIGAQELDGVLLKDVEGALWTREMIERSFDTPFRQGSTATQDERISVFDRIVVVVGSRGENLYVLEDASVRGLSPEGWANRVAAAAARWDTSVVVAEANNGGAMVESVLKAADLGLRVRLVHASKGKSARAEPVALKFERGKAFFAGHFPELEAELRGMQAGGGYEGPGRSPDRADAMVWAMTVLGETKSGVPRVRRL